MKNILAIFIFSALLLTKSVGACTGLYTLSEVPITFHYHGQSHYLGLYTIFLDPTLLAIQEHHTKSGRPYFEKKWYADCPSTIHSKRCLEFTVYPMRGNVTPDMMHKIEKYTLNNQPNQGEIRIWTNMTRNQYIYSTNRNEKFCGPYRIYKNQIN